MLGLLLCLFYNFLIFLRLSCRWKGSVWKAVWIQYVIWLALFGIVSAVYRFALTEWQRRAFTDLVDFTNSRLSYIPLDLMLGFFVAGVLNRFWYLYNIIGFMDNIALMTALYVRGTSERARQYRRNIVRYSQLTQVLVFRDLSMRCRKRFPTLDTVAAAGFMMPHEKENFDGIQYNYNKYFLPFNWAWALIYRARMEGLIESDYYVTILSEEVRKFRTDLAWLCNYDWVPLPMIYPTIVCLAVHTYFLVCVIARQYVEGSKYESDMHLENNSMLVQIDMVFPFMTSIQFVLYMGWLKVAEALLNPWGLDDDDFETNVLIDRNLAVEFSMEISKIPKEGRVLLQMGLKIVDDGYGKTPELRKDAFWDDEWVPLYSEESAWEKKYTQHEGSLSHIKLDRSVSQVRMVPLHEGAPSGSSSRRRMSSIRETIVPVKPEETTRRSSIAQFIRSASKLSLHTEGRKLSKNSSTPHFRTHSAKEPSMRMSTCNSDDVQIAPAPNSDPRLFSASQSGTTLGRDGVSTPASGELSRVMTDESAMQMFAIGESDFRIGERLWDLRLVVHSRFMLILVE
ncbi:Bestrophin [Ancylostoma caninum]|uniref:Bestrophin homolog n=2 Tax=Ancylostoma TaxID=29169 RepID=A0A368G209_ANCCA|nr:Bestrophin [Ancylostoma caninum]